MASEKTATLYAIADARRVTDPRITACLEGLLAEAKDGKIKAFAYVAEHVAETEIGHTGSHFSLLVLLQRLTHRINAAIMNEEKR